MYQRLNSTITHTKLFQLKSDFFPVHRHLISLFSLLISFNFFLFHQFRFFSSVHVLLQMHSRFLVFVWRRKFILFGTSLIFLLAIWLWGFLYTAHVGGDDNKGVSIKVCLNYFLPILDCKHISLMEFCVCVFFFIRNI